MWHIIMAASRWHWRKKSQKNMCAKSSKIQAQKNECKIRAQNLKFYILEISWKPHDGNFLETICWEISLKLYAGKFGWIPVAF